MGASQSPAFYVRRALRIWPLYYLVVFIAFAVVPWLMHHAAGAYVREAWSWYLDGIPGDGRLLLYVVLLPHIAYFTAPPVLCAAHLWSIGVEEQFYVVWPWLMRLAGRRPLAMFTLVVLAGFALNDLVFPRGEQLGRWVGADALEHLRMYADHAHMEAMAIGAFVGWGAVHERPLLERLAGDPLARVFAYLALPFGLVLLSRLAHRARSCARLCLRARDALARAAEAASSSGRQSLRSAGEATPCTSFTRSPSSRPRSRSRGQASSPARWLRGRSGWWGYCSRSASRRLRIASWRSRLCG